MKIKQNRRSFLKSCLAAGVVSAVPGWAFAAPQGAGQHTQTRLLLGTTVSITVAHHSADFASRAMASAFEEVERLQAVFNRHDASSALGILNSQGVLADAPVELVELVGESINIGKSLNGAFDISVAPLVDFLANSANSSFDKQEFAEARKLVDISAVKLGKSSIHLQKSGMALTLDGIAKGDIADKAAVALIKAGAENFLINAGGDIYASGSKLNGKKWMVAVESPLKDGAYPAVLPLHNAALATSGSYETAHAGNKRFNHLIQPGSGLSQQAFQSVTVAAPTVKMADALATGLAAMGLRDAMRIIENTNGCAGMFIDNNGRIHTSTRWG